MPRRVSFLLLLSLFGLAVPEVARAQQVAETVGSRALGMGGAFVAVADDAMAVYWNPAGLAGGAPLGATVGWVRLRTRDQTTPPGIGATFRSSHFTSLGTIPLGISYGSVQTTTITTNTSGGLITESLKVSSLGGTFLQTVAPGLVVGGTFKYLRGTVASGPVTGETTRAALDAGADLDGRTSGKFDLDVGVMADMGALRVGLLTRNLRTPTFEGLAGTATSIKLQRLSRLGIAGKIGDGLTLAMDLDLNTADLRDGLRRMIAFGGETRLGGRLAVRAGVRWNLKGIRQLTYSTGLSVAIRHQVWLDGHYTLGHIDGDRGFGFALRAGI